MMIDISLPAIDSMLDIVVCRSAVKKQYIIILLLYVALLYRYLYVYGNYRAVNNIFCLFCMNFTIVFCN